MVTCGAQNNTGHCCWINGTVCVFLRDDGLDATRRWVCTLREELGSWEAVHKDIRYIEKVRPTLDKFNQANCGYWPGPGVTCGECGVSG